MVKDAANPGAIAPFIPSTPKEKLRLYQEASDAVEFFFGLINWVPLSPLGEKAFGDYFARRTREARELLLDELENGYHGRVEDWDFSDDELLSTLHRWSQAARNGAAKENLRMLAQVMIGQKKEGGHDSDQFRRWAGTLEDLSRDEIWLIGMAYRAMAECENDKLDSFWANLKARTKGLGSRQNEVEALCAAVSRTGLIAPVSAFDTIAYRATPWLEQLGELANLEGFVEKPR